METKSTRNADDSRKGMALSASSAVRMQSSEQELEILYQISTSISSRLELTEVLDQIIGLVNFL
jgi:hypothetical protein